MSNDHFVEGRCFVIQPFDGGKFDKRYKDTFEPAIRAAGLEPYRVDRDPSVEIPIAQIEDGIRDSDACLAEITLDNPNVWFELGFALASGKPTCLVCSAERERFPFDVQHRAIIRYRTDSSSDFDMLKNGITEKLRALLKQERNVTNIAALSSTTATQGLTPYELAALALLMPRTEYGVALHALTNDMRKAGYTELATSVAVQKLRRAKLVEVSVERDDNANEYSGWRLTSLGIDWVLQHEKDFQMRCEPGTVAGKQPSFR